MYTTYLTHPSNKTAKCIPKETYDSRTPSIMSFAPVSAFSPRLDDGTRPSVARLAKEFMAVGTAAVEAAGATDGEGK